MRLKQLTIGSQIKAAVERHLTRMSGTCQTASDLLNRRMEHIGNNNGRRAPPSRVGPLPRNRQKEESFPLLGVRTFRTFGPIQAGSEGLFDMVN